MSKKTAISVFGAGGRMGKAILEQVAKNDSATLALAVDSHNFKDLETVKSEVIIDFSSPSGSVDIARWCASKKIPLVVGTTGLNDEQLKAVQKTAESAALLVSPNMSVGVFSLTEAFKTFLATMKTGEVFIEETHHVNKKDAPSGTAKFLFDVLKVSASPQIKVHAPTSRREGDVFGIHRVTFVSEGEKISFEHEATGRSVFAHGAVMAGIWLAHQKPGSYQMKDWLQK